MWMRRRRIFSLLFSSEGFTRSSSMLAQWLTNSETTAEQADSGSLWQGGNWALIRVKIDMCACILFPTPNRNWTERNGSNRIESIRSEPRRSNKLLPFFIPFIHSFIHSFVRSFIHPFSRLFACLPALNWNWKFEIGRPECKRFLFLYFSCFFHKARPAQLIEKGKEKQQQH